MTQPTVAIILLAGFQGGGAERVVAMLATHPPAGAKIVLITNRGPDDDRYGAALDLERVVLGVDIDEQSFAVNPIMALPRIVQLLIRTRRALRARRPDAVLAMLTTANLLAIIAARGLGIRVVVSERNDPTREQTNRLIRAARGLLYRFADVVTANTTLAVEARRPYVRDSRLAYVPNPVVVPAALHDSGCSPTIITVGRLTAHKDQATLLEAFAKLGAQANDWTLTLVGEGPMLPTLKQRAGELGIASRVVFTGYVVDPAPLLEAAGVFVLTSQHEGMPNALLEAMAYAVPCVVADCLPGALEVIGDSSGVAFRAGDADDLAAKLAMLLADDELRAKLGSAARQRVRSLSPHDVSARWAALLVPKASQ